MKKLFPWIVSLLFSVIYSVNTEAQCISSGARNGTTFTNNASIGTLPWTTPSNVQTSNTVAAISGTPVAPGTSVTTNYLYVQNFGFTLPASAIICGIAVKLEHKQQGANNVNTFVFDNEVYLLNASGIAGPNHSFPWCWNSSFSNIVHGSSSDVWGGNWTAADINSPSFGVAVSANLRADAGTSAFLSADMDHVSITVFYTLPLPVELISFDAIVTNTNEVNLQWSTATETNSDHFSIQRSTDGVNWEEIERITAAGNSNVLVNYSVTDEQPIIGESYYRLEQTDINGDSHFSEVVNAHVEPSEDIRLKYIPMETNILVNADTESAISVSVYDCSGREVKNICGNGNIIVPIDGLAPGIYTVTAQSVGQRVVQKFYFY